MYSWIALSKYILTYFSLSVFGISLKRAYYWITRSIQHIQRQSQFLSFVQYSWFHCCFRSIYLLFPSMLPYSLISTTCMSGLVKRDKKFWRKSTCFRCSFLSRTYIQRTVNKERSGRAITSNRVILTFWSIAIISISGK